MAKAKSLSKQRKRQVSTYLTNEEYKTLQEYAGGISKEEGRTVSMSEICWRGLAELIKAGAF